MYGQTTYSLPETKLLKLLSNSSIGSLNTCPRKFELERLLPQLSKELMADNVDTNFGASWGAGVAELFLGKSLEDAIFAASLNWQTDLFAVKKQKSFAMVVVGLERSVEAVEMLLATFEVVSIEGVPAIELSLRIDCGDNFFYRGRIDVLLMNKQSRELVVLDCKTTGFSSITDASFANSGQALSYSIITDAVARNNPSLDFTSSYTVLYMVFLVGQAFKEEPIQILTYTKPRYLRALWIKQLLLDMARVQLYLDEGMFPMIGSSCFAFFTTCPYFETCTMDAGKICQHSTVTSALAREAKTPYTFSFTIDEVLESQLPDNTN